MRKTTVICDRCGAQGGDIAPVHVCYQPGDLCRDCRVEVVKFAFPKGIGVPRAARQS